jgi:hypothetical protein
MKKLPILGVLIAAGAMPAAAQDAIEQAWSKIQPTRAVYVLRQRGSGESGNGTVAMSGRVVVELRLNCTEIATLLQMDLRASSGGGIVTMKLEQKSAETRDGRIYRFSAATYENGRESERREGQAVLQGREGPGEAKIKGASGEDLKLEPGTILPGTHLMRMLQAAAAGKKGLENRVFYGFDQMKITGARVTILGAGRSGKEKGLGEFADKPGWRIREEYKEIGGEPGAATQTSEMFVTEDGVTTELSLSMQGLELAGTAISIEKLAKPECK